MPCHYALSPCHIISLLSPPRHRSYVLAPNLVPPAERSRASGVMTVAFQSSCVLALGGAALVQGWVGVGGAATMH